jgi:hypothetical protein
MTTRYTSTPPTEAGWYWMRNGKKERIVELRFEHLFRDDVLCKASWISDPALLLCERGVQFAGPIPRPEE